MNDTCAKESLKKFRLTIESLELSKQIAAAKWLEGVVVAQVLTNEEREEIIEAANEYVGKVEEEKYVDAINALGGVSRACREKHKRRAEKAQETRRYLSPQHFMKKAEGTQGLMKIILGRSKLQFLDKLTRYIL